VDLHCAGGTYAGKDPASAFKYTLQAAEQGYAPAQAAAGIMYATDKGVQQNYAEAAKWWIAAAVGGYLLAASNLSMLYRSGVRLKPDANAANKWAKFVADCGAGAAH
jgi:TPR repeat protein